MSGQAVVQTVLSVFTTVLASSGLWAFLSHKQDLKYQAREKQRQLDEEEKKKDDVYTKLLVGIAHDRLMFLTNKYIETGWITADDYENLMYIYEPYIASGGNGTVKRNMEKVEKLPTKPSSAL